VDLIGGHFPAQRGKENRKYRYKTRKGKKEKEGYGAQGEGNWPPNGWDESALLEMWLSPGVVGWHVAWPVNTGQIVCVISFHYT